MADLGAKLVVPPLSPAQIAFLVSLLSGPRRTADCHDAITVGGLLRLNLVAWHDEHPKRRGRKSTFSLTDAAVHLLSLRSGRQQALYADAMPCLA